VPIGGFPKFVATWFSQRGLVARIATFFFGGLWFERLPRDPAQK
jgi:hypothetical protein